MILVIKRKTVTKTNIWVELKNLSEENWIMMIMIFNDITNLLE